VTNQLQFFLINKNDLVNNENNKCLKCINGMNLYPRKKKGKGRTILSCERKGCQTTQSLGEKIKFLYYFSLFYHNCV